MTDLFALKASNARRWANAKITRGPEFAPVASRLVNARLRYLSISERTGVPWFVIAVIHEREASQRWDRSIAQGDPWNAVSKNVPAGRGPFKSFDDAAYDALVNCPPYAARNKDWSAGGTLTLLEQYNGLGYAAKGLPSPYIWSGTDQYKSGKYVADHVFDPNAVDKQLGCAGLLLAMQQIDSSITFGGVKPKPVPVTPIAGPAPTGKPAEPARTAAKDASKQGIFALIVAGIVAAFTWLLDHPILAIGATVVIVGAGVFAWRWWKHTTAIPLTGYDAMLALHDSDTGSAGKLAEPAAPAPAPKTKRAPRKPAAKPKGKRKATKRKAA